MDLLVLDTNLEAVEVLDTFESLIWTDRYSKWGDFEIYTAITPELVSVLREDYYLWLKESEHVMIIEDLEITTDSKEGTKFKVTGRSLESILDRRIIWGQTILTGNFQDGIEQLLNENIINPSVPERKIDNFVFEPSVDPRITELTIDTQYTGDNLYDSIQKLCEANNIGFKIILTDDNLFKFKLYSGTDRSYNQLENPYIIFSPKFDNLLSSNYIESKKTLKTISLVAGEGEGSDRKTTVVESPSGGGSGLLRRELFTDARDVSSKVNNGTLTDTEYIDHLTQKGLETLAENAFINSFEGQVEATNIYKYGEDFSMGDILQIVNEYDMEARARIIEVVHSQSTSSIDIYPTFATVE